MIPPKNYSLLLGPATVRLAPLYDVLSSIPYPRQIPPRSRKLAMRIDREYVLRKISRRHWEGMAARCELDADPLVNRVREVVAAVPDAAGQTAVELRQEGLEHGILDRLEEGITEHARECLQRLA